MPPDLEVCVVSYDSADVIADCVRSVAEHVPGARVAVREHGPSGSGAAAAAAAGAATGIDVRVAHDASNPGFAGGCNALAADSAADWLLFLNPDATVTAWPWADDAPPRRRIIGPVIDGSGAPGRHYGTSYRVRDEIARSWGRRVGRMPAGAGFVSGAALLIERDAFASLGGFDEDYFLFYEDIDLCLRANECGIATHVEPAWRVHHGGAHSTSSRFAASLQWSYASGRRFHAARGEPLVGYRVYVVTDALLRAGAATALRDRRRAVAYGQLARRVATGAPLAAPPGPSTDASARAAARR